MKGIDKVYEFLKKCGTYYLATADGNQPRVRPFGTIDLFGGNCIFKRKKQRGIPSDEAKSANRNLRPFGRKLAADRRGRRRGRRSGSARTYAGRLPSLKAL